MKEDGFSILKQAGEKKKGGGRDRERGREGERGGGRKEGRSVGRSASQENGRGHLHRKLWSARVITAEMHV